MRILVPFAVLLHSVTVSGRLCNQAVGIQNRTIPDQAFTASSSFNKWHGPHQARLNNVKTSKGEGAWCSKTTQVGEYIQVDLGRVRLLSKIATQGRNTTYSLYVSKYILHYSPNGIAYNVFPTVFGSQEAKVFDANKDKNTIVYNDLMLRHEPLQARYVRLFPQAFNGKMCLRLELYECIGGRCAVNNGGCSHNCSEPTPGIAVCQCPRGYKLLPLGKICQDVNECAKEHGCNGTCVNTVGSYRCECSHGMKLGNDGKSCLDINECLPDKNPCDSRSTICENEIGSYTCKCKQGFKSTWNKHICKDLDECDLGTDLCDSQSTKCRNVIGSYECDCRPGLKKKPVTAHRCHDIDECSLSNGGCSHNCTNTFGSFRCTCPAGYLISAGNSKQCVDRNECLAGNGGCEWFCNNTVGSYQCSCLHGYELAADRHKCNDIDECSKNMDKCDRNSTKCNNFVGGYQCDCKTGYKYVIGNKYKCQLRDCPPLVLSEGTAVSPQTCLQAKVMKVGSTCKFSCKTGFRLPSDKNTLTCLSSGHWDAANIACQRIKCPPLAAPANGNLYPSSCKSTGAKYQGNCYYSCSQGFVLSGVSKKTCLQDSNWDSLQTPTCTRSYDKPWITCPSNVITTLPPGVKESDVTLLLGSARSNYQKNIKVFPLIYNGNLVFRVGKTKLYFVANNPAGETSNCSIVINVMDKEAPKVVSYPSNQYLLAKGHDVVATWETPKFSDNVGVVRVTSTKNSGDRFSIGSTTVHITAYDEAGNSISVSFEIRVTRAKCPELAKHENGNLTCIEFPMFKYCYITCTNNKKLFSITPGSSCSTTSLVWDPPLPDCVGYANQTAGVCPKGKVPQSATISFPPVEKICVSCPKGMYYREQNKTCVKCPIGFISTAEESLACTKCPDGYSTMATGSRTCTALCKPGSASPDGFNRYDIQKPCYLCIIGFYQNEEGSTSCKRCPNGSTTLFPGAKSASTCGGPPSITLFGPRYVNVTEKNQFSFECRASGSPHPVFNVTKLKEPPPGYGGPRKIEHINEGGIQVGLRFTIFSALEHDNGVYACQASNTFGSDIKYLQVNVKLHIIHGRRKKRDYKRL